MINPKMNFTHSKLERMRWRRRNLAWNAKTAVISNEIRQDFGLVSIDICEYLITYDENFIFFR